MLRTSRIYLVIATVIALAIPASLAAQNIHLSDLKMGTVVGTAVDVNGNPVPNAIVRIKRSENSDGQMPLIAENGFFEFTGVQPGVPYQISITADDFADWTSSPMTLDPGQLKIVTGIQLRIRAGLTHAQVTYHPLEVATEQLKGAKQRVRSVVPNSLVCYETNPAVLTVKMKFHLGLKSSTDPVTVGVFFATAGVRQAGNRPTYGQGWGAYGKRVGVTAADGFSRTMIGTAILPSLLHQDPRYFYQGTGTTSSRTRHAMLSPFIARGDNGRWEPNYSTIGGDLMSSALSNIYYPHANRGPKLVFGDFAISTAGRVGASLAQEFIISKFIRRGDHTRQAQK